MAPASAPARAKSRPISQIPAGDRLRAKDVAQLEGCSPRTAQRLINSGAFGKVYSRNTRVRWIDRFHYNRWIETK